MTHDWENDPNDPRHGIPLKETHTPDPPRWAMVMGGIVLAFIFAILIVLMIGVFDRSLDWTFRS